MPANEERSISLGQLQERPMKEPTSDTEGRYGDGAARTKVRRPKPKALLYHVCSNRIELLFQNGEHKVALVRSAIKQVAKRSAIGEEKGIEFAVEMMTSGLAKGRNASRQSSSATALPQNILNGLCQHGGRSSLPSYYSSTRGLDFASLYGLRAKALDPPLNPTTVRLSVLLSLKTTEEFQFPKQPSPKQQLEPIQLMKEDLPSRKGLKAS
ncbi:hypothetical protein Tco_1214969 [Tanacetum coccineum]